jgi:3-deoxy-D-manno-octulosonic-acid transferase
MQRALYQLLLLLALPLLPFRLLWRGLRQPGYLMHVGERFGWYDTKAAPSLLWLHAVSVGEVRAAQPLLSVLKTEFPRASFLITVMTPTGRETAGPLCDARVAVVYLPYDYGATVARFLDHFKPRAGLILETELWPNLLEACAQRKLPVALVNARLSEKSARGYRRFSDISRAALGSLAHVTAQSEADAARLSSLGAPRVTVTGNIKFDITPDAALRDLGRTWRAVLPAHRKVVMLASSREGEEAVVLDAWKKLPANIRNDRLLVIVPRHPQRFDEVAALITHRGFSLGRRSNNAGFDAEVWLGDSMGEMAAYFELAHIVIMGGSLLATGSQNLIEPCAQGRPVVLGPSIFNFQEAASLAVREGAARQVANGAETVACAIDRLSDDAQMTRAAEAALRFTSSHRGATTRTLEVLRPLLAGRLP